ncbi:Pentatricopeptide repeat-containing protein [Durusdinium trenchii]|uniref:Chloroplastic n=1 Tax=Durusdinium trenchii TaxID=1381693 RepID=A0ABP0N7Y8_9DINO
MGRRGQKSSGHDERNKGGPVSQLEDLMRRRGVDAAWDALEDVMGAEHSY